MLWPGARPSRHHGTYRASGSAPILVIGTTGDPDTPYRDAVALTRYLENARLLTFRAEGHAAFDRSQCVAEGGDCLSDQTHLATKTSSCGDQLKPPPATAARTPTSPPTGFAGIDDDFEPGGLR